MTDTPTHINVMINSSIDDNVDSSINDDEDDRDRLLKPRNNFASYSNENINVRFRVMYLSRSNGILRSNYNLNFRFDSSTDNLTSIYIYVYISMPIH